jgi:hypothetical protein
MNKKLSLLLAFALIGVSANAQIRVYDPNTGKDMSLESLVDNGILEIGGKNPNEPKTVKIEAAKSKYNEPSSATTLNAINTRKEIAESGDYSYETHPERYVDVYQTRAEKKKAAIAKLDSLLAQEAEHNKNIEDRKISNLGTVVVFVDVLKLERSDAKNLMGFKELNDVAVEFFMAPLKTPLAMQSVSFKMRGELDGVMFSSDKENKNARRLHVNSYPQVIYIDPDMNRSRYGMSSGGLAALKLRLGEVAAYKELKRQQEAEKNNSKNK